jgi:uncharacterized protein
MSENNLDKKLDRLSRFITPAGSGLPVCHTPSDPVSCSYPARYRAMADTLGGELIAAEEGAYCLVRTQYPFGHRFGHVDLTEQSPTAAVSQSAFTLQEIDRRHELSRLLFFDTETTGLGGSGAVAFLIGFGSLTGSGFEIRQYVLPDYSDETAMLEAVLAECGDRRTLVSYNGAAFDIPLVRDRMIVNRVARSFEPTEHIDLLHPTRRLFRRRLGDCTLTNVEREIFGYFRSDDIPGYLIPSVYFEWLNSESLTAMSQVLEHNRLDILALYFLALRLDEVFATEGRSLDRADDIHSLSRVYGRRKQHARVVELYRAINETSEDLAPDALLYHSFAMKRLGRMEDAVRLWGELVSREGREAYAAALELAKYCEHRLGDCSLALEYALRAGELAPAGDNHRSALDRRVERLQGKIDRSC